MDRILLVPDDMRDAMFSVIVERERQDGEWGGAEHDEEHTVAEWKEIMAKWRHRLERILPNRGEDDSAWQPGDLYQLGDGLEEAYRRHLVILAALLIAIIQCIDRSRMERAHRPGRSVDG